MNKIGIHAMNSARKEIMVIINDSILSGVVKVDDDQMMTCNVNISSIHI